MNTPNTPPNDESLPEYLRGVADKTKIIPLSQATPLKAKLAEKGKGKPVPTIYKHLVKIEYFRKFPLKERILILFGANLVTLTGIATQHNCGNYQPMTIGKISTATSASNYMQGIVDNMLEDRDPKSPVVHEPGQVKGPEIR